MKTLDFERMEKIEGGSCTSATFGLIGSWIGLGLAAASGPLAPFAGAAAICAIVAESASFDEQC